MGLLACELAKNSHLHRWWRSSRMTRGEFKVCEGLQRRFGDHRHHISTAQMAVGHWIRAGDKTVTWHPWHCPSPFSFSSSHNSLCFHPLALRFLLLPHSQLPIFSNDTVFWCTNRLYHSFMDYKRSGDRILRCTMLIHEEPCVIYIIHFFRYAWWMSFFRNSSWIEG